MKKTKNNLFEIKDIIYPIVKLSKDKYEICDHINLTGVNPLKKSEFISLTQIYNSKNGIVVACLKKGTKLNKKEIARLLKAGVKAYCYNLASKVIHAASRGLKVKAIGIVSNEN